MPFTLHFEPESGIVVATASGELGPADAREGAQAFWGHTEWHGRSVLWDMRAATLDVTAVDVQAIAKFVLEHQPANPAPRIAFVTDRNADYGMVRMFEVMREHPSTEVRVFRDYAEAVGWLRAA